MTTSIDTVIVGAGQAGLSTAYHLTKRDITCVAVDAGKQVGDNWRHQWDSLHLYTPARYNCLPGMPFPGDPWHFPSKDETADYLTTYASDLGLPVRMNTRVDRVAGNGSGYTVSTDGERISARNVVIATGTFGRTANVPDTASELDPDIVQLHSSEYRGAEQLPPGRVLVVGAAHSGFDIAYEVARHRQTVLAGRDCGQIPVRLDSRRMRVMFPVLWLVWGHILNRRTPVGRKAMAHARFHGAPALRVKRSDLADVGVERIEERVVASRDGLPQLANGRVLDVSSVIWATGFKQRFDWIDLPVFDDRGWPRERRGVVPDAPGLYFCGLSFQSSFRSMLIGGAGHDAEFIAKKIADRSDR